MACDIELAELDVAANELNFIQEEEEEKEETPSYSNVCKCLKCSETFSSLSRLAKHFNSVHGTSQDGREQCPACVKTYFNHSKLKRHIEETHELKKVPCPHCAKLFQKSSLRNHINSSHGSNQVFQCEECIFTTHVKRYLKAHILKCHQRDKHVHKCDTCSKTFPFPYLLKEHVEIDHLGVQNHYVCEKCGKGFAINRKYMFEEHVKKMSCGSKNGTNQVTELVKCCDCEDEFTGELYYRLHYKNIHGGLPPSYQNREQFMCDKCPSVYLSKHSLQTHTKTKHSISSSEITSKSKSKRYKCSHCDRTFSLWLSCKEHVKSKHEKSTPHKCSECHRSYGTLGRLKIHRKNMHQKVICIECGQTIYNMFTLKRHMASVHGIIPPNSYQCEYCPLFYEKQILKDRHVSKHHPASSSQ